MIGEVAFEGFFKAEMYASWGKGERIFPEFPNAFPSTSARCNI
jgi:hypothetical protein